jgi:hypothetical protein
VLVYLLCVCLLNVWLEDVWILEIVDEVSQVEVFGRQALVVRDVRDAWHDALGPQLISGSGVLKVERDGVSRCFAGRGSAVEVAGLSGEIYPATPHFSWFACEPIMAASIYPLLARWHEVNLTFQIEDILYGFFPKILRPSGMSYACSMSPMSNSSLYSERAYQLSGRHACYQPAGCGRPHRS